MCSTAHGVSTSVARFLKRDKEAGSSPSFPSALNPEGCKGGPGVARVWGAMALGILVGFLRGGRAVPRTGISALTSKRGPRNFYKGKGCKSTGRHTSKGGYVLMEEKLPKYIVPDLTNCKMLPYVAHDTPKLEVVKDKVAT